MLICLLPSVFQFSIHSQTHLSSIKLHFEGMKWCNNKHIWRHGVYCLRYAWTCQMQISKIIFTTRCRWNLKAPSHKMPVHYYCVEICKWWLVARDCNGIWHNNMGLCHAWHCTIVFIMDTLSLVTIDIITTYISVKWRSAFLISDSRSIINISSVYIHHKYEQLPYRHSI